MRERLRSWRLDAATSTLSTLRSYVETLGGHLEIAAVVRR